MEMRIMTMMTIMAVMVMIEIITELRSEEFCSMGEGVN